MLPKTNRLKKKKDIERVFKIGWGSRQGFLAIKFAKNEQEVSRFGFIVSSKVSKKASSRNKIKRRLRELIRINLKGIKEGYDILLIALPGLDSKRFGELKDNVGQIFLKTKLIK